MPERPKKKVLILTLGTGRKLPNGAPAGYEKASYQFEDDREKTETAYVAEPLVRAFQPDMIFVIGTIKSAWLEFYQYFTEQKTEEAELLFCDLDPVSGRDVGGEELRRDAEALNRIFADGMDRAPFSPDIKTRVILTRYGMNNDELLENYRLISSIGAYMDEDTDYEIAFDITHSFRSLPIYNLIILNYLSVISAANLDIAHIYYGNLDVRRENGGIAPILDLQDLINVMSLTNGVSEFKNTGNCRTLLEQIPEESPVRDALEKFDWATQINSFDKVQESLETLLRLTEVRASDSSRYTDLNRMIHTVLCRKFLKWEGTEAHSADRLAGMSLADRRLMTSVWYLNQNRYGQAVVTAYEALKSCLVPIYLTEILKKPELREGDGLKEVYLRSAVQRLESVYIYCRKKKETEKLTRMEQFFVELELTRRKAVPIRNRFAHNLTEDGSGKLVRMKPKQEKACIFRLVELIEQLQKEIAYNRDEVVAVYKKKAAKNSKKSHTGAGTTENIVVVTEHTGNVPYQDYLRTRTREYDVYAFDRKVVQAIAGNKNKVENALLLQKILRRQELDCEHTQIYFYGMDGMTLAQYAMVLQEEQFKQLSRIREDGSPKVIHRIDVRFDRDYYEEYELKEELDDLQYMDLIEIGD